MKVRLTLSAIVLFVVVLIAALLVIRVWISSATEPLEPERVIALPYSDVRQFWADPAAGQALIISWTGRGGRAIGITWQGAAPAEFQPVLEDQPYILHLLAGNDSEILAINTLGEIRVLSWPKGGVATIGATHSPQPAPDHCYRPVGVDLLFYQDGIQPIWVYSRALGRTIGSIPNSLASEVPVEIAGPPPRVLHYDSTDTSIVSYEVPSLRELGRVPIAVASAHGRFPPNNVLITADGTAVLTHMGLTSERSDEVHEWDAATGRHRRRHKLIGPGVWADMSLSPDSAWAAVAGEVNITLIHRPTRRRYWCPLIAYVPDRRTQLAFSGDSRYLAAIAGREQQSLLVIELPIP